MQTGGGGKSENFVDIIYGNSLTTYSWWPPVEVNEDFAAAPCLIPTPKTSSLYVKKCYYYMYRKLGIKYPTEQSNITHQNEK